MPIYITMTCIMQQNITNRCHYMNKCGDNYKFDADLTFDKWKSIMNASMGKLSIDKNAHIRLSFSNIN